MIEISWLNDSNFKLDWSKDKSIYDQNKEITQQLYAFVMGWAWARGCDEKEKTDYILLINVLFVVVTSGYINEITHAIREGDSKASGKDTDEGMEGKPWNDGDGCNIF